MIYEVDNKERLVMLLKDREGSKKSEGVYKKMHEKLMKILTRYDG